MSGAAIVSDIEDIYELSPMQIGMLFQSLLLAGSGVFVEQQVMRLSDNFDTDAFARAWQTVVDRTPVLRTTFHWEKLEKPVQVVHRSAKLPVERLDWRGQTAQELTDRMTSYLRDARRAAFDFGRAPLMRVALVHTSASEVWFVWHFHHILLDGWSGQLLLQDLADEYQSAHLPRPHSPAERPPYSAYIGWLQTRDRAAAEAFWRTELAGFTDPTPLGIGRTAAPDASAGNDGQYVQLLPAAGSGELRRFAKTNRLTLNTLLQGAWALVLSRYSGERDVVFGTVVSGRPGDLPGVESMIGLFINTLPVRVHVHPGDELLSWLHGIQKQHLRGDQFQHVSALQLQQWSELPRGTKLFDTALILENFPSGAQNAEGAAATDEPMYLGRTDLGITVMVVPGDAIRLKFLYDHRRFDGDAIARMAGHFAGLLAQFPKAPRAELRELSLVSPAERETLLASLTAAGQPDYADTPIAVLLEEQAARTPDGVAFVEAARSTSVSEVNERSSQLARYLIEEERVTPGTVVGVCHERSTATAIALLALLKARAVYLPLDPSFPSERLAYTIRDAGTRLVLGRQPGEGDPEVRTVDLEAALARAARYADACPWPPAAPRDLAYIIYTSGSTGHPKGVAVEHGAILNRLHWMWREYPFAVDDIGVMRTALGFVDAFWEILGGVLKGVPTVVAPEAVSRDVNAFVELLAERRVTRIWLVPSFLELLLDAMPDLGVRVPSLRFWSLGGEALTTRLYERFRRAVPRGRLYNVYGASEFWDATVFEAGVEPPAGDLIPIGRPIANTEAYVLDPDGRPVPVGVTGRLYIGGACLARGYVNRDELTQARFIPHPFRTNNGDRVYDTGDLARVRADGVLEYAGRRDLQIKLRGFRIEPGEVEATLEAHPAVSESVVVARELGPGDTRLIAYIVAAGALDLDALLAYVRERLPPHMVPAAFVPVESIPMTPTGKRDRAALPAPGRVAGRARARRPPVSPVEQAVAAAFQELAGAESVGLDDDFFADLGGHSLLATRLVSRIREALDVELPLRAVFDTPTAGGLAAVIANGRSAAAAADGDAETAAILADVAGLPPDELDRVRRALRGDVPEGDG